MDIVSAKILSIIVEVVVMEEAVDVEGGGIMRAWGVE